MIEVTKLQQAKDRLLSLVPEPNRADAIEIISEMLSLQSQSDIEAVELVVPTKSVLRKVDLGPLEIAETTAGVLFSAKGTMSTLLRPTVSPVDGAPSGAYAVMLSLIEQMDTDFKNIEDPESRTLAETFAQCWLYILQAPIFCSLSPDYACDVASLIVNKFSKFSEEHLNVKTPNEETKEDALRNAEVDNSIMAKEMAKEG